VVSDPTPVPGEPARRRHRWVLAAVALAAVVLVAAVVAVVVVTRDGSGGGTRAPAASPGPETDVDLSALPIARAAFCDRLDAGDVADALDGPVAATRDYGSGERVLLEPGLRDVSHEFGCSYAAANGARARVWVFAEPVARRVATAIARAARGGQGCRSLGASPTFGRPSAHTVCPASRTGRAVTLRGLFGDAWLTCQVSAPASVPRAALVRRSDRWCVRVATTLGTRP